MIERHLGVGGDAPSKALYVPDGFAGIGDGDVPYLNLSNRQMQKCRAIFESAGYRLLPGVAAQGDDESLGIFADARFLEASGVNSEIARLLSLRVPERISLDRDPSTIAFPVVARYPRALHGGRGVYLIET